jgi:hypothetical protein
MKSMAAPIPLNLWFENVLKKYHIQPIQKLSAIRLAKMKRVLAVKTPVGGVVQIVPCENNGAAVALSWREAVLSDAEKEASRLYLFDEGFIERAAGTLEPDMEIERFLKGIPDSN